MRTALKTMFIALSYGLLAWIPWSPAVAAKANKTVKETVGTQQSSMQSAAPSNTDDFPMGFLPSAPNSPAISVPKTIVLPQPMPPPSAGEDWKDE